MPYWLKAIEDQTIPLSDIGFQFELGHPDGATHDILWEWQQSHTECWLFDAQINEAEPHKTHEEGKRSWKVEEFLRMVTFRNNLLERAAVRLDKFDYYFSLDSDVILEDPRTIEKLVSYKKDVVSPYMFMTPHDVDYPNGMNWAITGSDWVGKRIRLETGLVEVDVPMAAILMSKKVVESVRYEWHPQGEDIGFAKNLYKQGFDSFIDFDTYAPHIMHRAQLKDFLANGDSRLQLL